MFLLSTIRSSMPTHQLIDILGSVDFMGHDRGPEGSGKIAQRISRVPLVVVVVVVVMVSVCTCGDNTPFWYLSFGESSRAVCPMQRGFELANLACRCLHAKFKDRHYHWPGLPRIDVIDCLVWH